IRRRTAAVTRRPPRAWTSTPTRAASCSQAIRAGLGCCRRPPRSSFLSGPWEAARSFSSSRTAAAASVRSGTGSACSCLRSRALPPALIRASDKFNRAIKNRGMAASSRTPVRREGTRAALIDAATRVFGRDGFHAASTKAIAREAGANPALISYHFGGKEGLYVAVVEHIVESMAARVGPIAVEVEAERRAL